MIDYQTLIDDAVLGVIKRVLSEHAIQGPKIDQCFYITFDTKYPKVSLPRRVKKKHPDYITIVLENEFNNLLIFDSHFTVNLVFGGLNENISVPFKSIISFMDPAANFSLQLKHEMLSENELHGDEDEDIMLSSSLNLENNIAELPKQPAEIIDFNSFRKKK